MSEIDPVSGSEMNPQFIDAFSDRLAVSKIAEFQAVKSDTDDCSGFYVFQRVKPGAKGRISLISLTFISIT